MKHILKAVAAAAVTVVLAGSAQAQSALHEILDSGVLKVGTTGDWNPMTLRDPATNSYKGYDIDIMAELAKDLGVEVEFVPADWKTLVNGVVAGKYHLTGSASISAPRMKVAGFSDSYIAVEIFPFTLKEKAGNFSGYASINQPGVKVATTLGTTFEKLVREWFPEADIKVVEAPARGFQEVLAGRADVFITSNIEGSTLEEKFPVTRVPDTGPRAPTPIAMLLPQDDQVWINYMNNWVKVKKATGFFEATQAKWGL
ncbi:transporter substrate-binding domain-containing protein [Leisingera sp. HS039]|uniref:transporter substrate-binding domain-containing protein n=1 Tax=unclassified Leisingera TaxID=2614906 RepID=UPI001070EABD|nr:MULTISPECIES: transporter substrate-binding domain-containing protein [unclassified Leisingera]MBQ4825110.1 transporter substrate-binding domain-containing protein [Leisingera sp. HS039]QBR38757.1 transporter substrate-binding domain-containing protein [Leisingera sp. NJS201]